LLVRRCDRAEDETAFIRHWRPDIDMQFPVFKTRHAEASWGKIRGFPECRWFQGRSEWGPRALGNRSILADPRNAEMKDVVNSKIKFREPYRPFAPSVLAQQAEFYFELPEARKHFPARYMLYVVPTKENQRENLAAVTHVDGTARVQTVSRKQNQRYYDLIERFGQATGVPVVLNTSFNLKGEPLANTPADAVSTFFRSEMECLVIGDFLIEKAS